MVLRLTLILVLAVFLQPVSAFAQRFMDSGGSAARGVAFAVQAAPTVSRALPQQVVLQPKDVPGAVEVRSQTHAVPGVGECTQGYQSLFASGLGGKEAPYSSAYRCPSAATATQQFAQSASYYRQYYNRPTWHFKVLPGVAAGHQHLAWFNLGLPGEQSYGTKPRSLATISLLFTRDNFIVLLQLTYDGETLAHAESSAHYLAHLMNRRIVLGS